MQVFEKKYFTIRHELKAPNGGNFKSLETAKGAAARLGIDTDEIKQDDNGFYFEIYPQNLDEIPLEKYEWYTLDKEIAQDGIGFYIEEKVAGTEGKSMPISQAINSKSEIKDVEEARKILEAQGLQIMSKDEIAEMKEQNKSDSSTLEKLVELTAMMAENSLLSKEEAARKELKEKELEEKHKKQAIAEETGSYTKIMNEPKVTLMVMRRRNANGVSTEKQRVAYNKEGSLMVNPTTGLAAQTEVIEVCFNNHIYSFDLGQDKFGKGEGLIMVLGVPWSIAVFLAEKRYPQALTHPITGEVVQPTSRRSNMYVTPQHLVGADGNILQSSIGQSLSR